jgi:hypothetical protein
MQPRQSHGARLRDRILVVGFVLAFGLPGLVTLAWSPTQTIEGEPLSRITMLGLRDLADARVFTQIDGYLDDRFPLDAVAVQARAMVSYGVFGTSPSRAVIAGRDGWLYYIDEVSPRCPSGAASVLHTTDLLAGEFAVLGRDFKLVIVPTKRTIYPEPLAGTQAGEPNCADLQQQEFLSGLSARPTTTVDLFTPLRAARGGEMEGSDNLFWHTDTHWNSAGMLVGVQALIATYPEISWDAKVVDNGTITRPTDLYRLMGLLTGRETGRSLSIERGITVTDTPIPLANRPPANRPVTNYVAIGAAPLVPGRTLVIYDSFFGAATSLIVPWFAETAWVHIDDVARPEIVAALPDFERVIVQRSERYAYSTDFLRALRPLLDKLR